MMLVHNDFIGAIIQAGLFALIIFMAEVWARCGNPAPETMRKFVHLNCGLACLLFPFVVKSPYVVLGMSAAFSLLFVIGKKVDILRCLNSVKRQSRGSEYYPFAIAIIFAISRGYLWLYISSVLILAVADAFAALIGKKYGAIRYKVADSEKSLEGSLFFWIIAFLAIQLPMLLLSGLPPVTCILTALLVSFMLTCVEAVSVRGSDNIFVPVIACYVLLKISEKPAPEILFQCISIFVIFTVFGFLIWRAKIIDFGGTVIFLCFAYAAWSLGSIIWAVPVLAGITVFLAVHMICRTRKTGAGNINSGTMISALVIPLGIIIFANAFGIYDIAYGPYLAVLTTIGTIGTWSVVQRYMRFDRTRRVLAVFVISILACLTVAGLPWLFLDGISAISLAGIFAATVPICVFHGSLRESEDLEGRAFWSTERFILSLTSGLLYLLFQYCWPLIVWCPE